MWNLISKVFEKVVVKAGRGTLTYCSVKEALALALRKTGYEDVNINGEL